MLLIVVGYAMLVSDENAGSLDCSTGIRTQLAAF